MPDTSKMERRWQSLETSFSATSSELRRAATAAVDASRGQMLEDGERRADELLEKLCDLGWEAAELHAVRQAEIRAKAMVLLEFCPPDEDDLFVRLCASLCRDLLKSVA